MCKQYFRTITVDTFTGFNYNIALSLAVDMHMVPYLIVRTQELYYYGSTIVQFVLQKKVSLVPRRFCGHTVHNSFDGV